MIFCSDCRQTLILLSTSDSSPTSSTSIGTCMILRSSWICPREKNEKHQENYAQPTRTFWATLSPEYSGSSLVFPTRPSISCPTQSLDCRAWCRARYLAYRFLHERGDEKEWFPESRICISTDRRENPEARLLARRDAIPPPRSDQASRP